MTDPRPDDEDPRMRFRVWVAGKLKDEAWIDVSNPDADRIMDNVRARHSGLTVLATAAGQPWLIEVYDPAKPEDEAYLRFGNDADGMVDPRPIS